MIGNKKHYLIAGSTGLIGTQLLSQLLDAEETGKVTTLVRSNSSIQHPKLDEKVIDWDTFTEKDIAPSVDAVFCCLGTTMAKARSKQAFKQVDFDYVLKLAVFSQRKGVAQFHVVSAKGADPGSRIFYNRVKGNMEAELHKLTKIRSIYIYQPSMLLGDREEFRLMETLGKIMMNTFKFLIPKSARAIYDIQVAMSMHHFAMQAKKGIHVIPNEKMISHTT